MTIANHLPTRLPLDAPQPRAYPVHALRTIVRFVANPTRLRPAIPHPPLVEPWSECRSYRGAPKHASTAGYACPDPNGTYAGNPDPKVHALVGYGHHGRREPIQDFRCQACRTKFTARRQTPLHRLKTASHRVAEVLTTLAEGLGIGAAVRVFGHGEGTIRTRLTCVGL